MIYQHRIVISRAGKLEKRHEMFQATTMQALDDAGSALVGAWEVYIGDETASAVWQLRQFESMARWAELQNKVREDAVLSEARQTQLYPYLDEVNKLIVVTGKGLHSQNEKDPYVSKDLSILKYSVPEFLSTNKSLMNIIYEITDAKIEDGGAGAFYIYLKKNNNNK